MAAVAASPAWCAEAFTDFFTHPGHTNGGKGAESPSPNEFRCIMALAAAMTVVHRLLASDRRVPSHAGPRVGAQRVCRPRTGRRRCVSGAPWDICACCGASTRDSARRTARRASRAHSIFHHKWHDGMAFARPSCGGPRPSTVSRLVVAALCAQSDRGEQPSIGKCLKQQKQHQLTCRHKCMYTYTHA